MHVNAHHYARNQGLARSRNYEKTQGSLENLLILRKFRKFAEKSRTDRELLRFLRTLLTLRRHGGRDFPPRCCSIFLEHGWMKLDVTNESWDNITAVGGCLGFFRWIHFEMLCCLIVLNVFLLWRKSPGMFGLIEVLMDMSYVCSMHLLSFDLVWCKCE